MFYINDGYVTADEVKGRSYSMYNKNNVRSLPVIARPSSNYVVSSYWGVIHFWRLGKLVSLGFFGAVFASKG